MTVTDQVNPVAEDGGWNTNFTSGLLDNYDLTVESSIFSTDATYNNGQTVMLIWTGTTNDADYPERSIFITLGSGWDTLDGGATIERVDGKPAQFNRSTKMAILIDRCLNKFGIGDLMRSRGSVFESKIWQGLTFHIEREVLDPTKTDAKATEFPVAFVGQAVATTQAPVAAAAPVVAAAVGLRDQVVGLFQASADLATAQQAALALPGVTSDGALVNEIVSGSLWNQVKG